jgi:hypothetical protein
MPETSRESFVNGWKACQKMAGSIGWSVFDYTTIGRTVYCFRNFTRIQATLEYSSRYHVQIQILIKSEFRVPKLPLINVSLQIGNQNLRPKSHRLVRYCKRLPMVLQPKHLEFFPSYRARKQRSCSSTSSLKLNFLTTVSLLPSRNYFIVHTHIRYRRDTLQNDILCSAFPREGSQPSAIVANDICTIYRISRRAFPFHSYHFLRESSRIQIDSVVIVYKHYNGKIKTKRE